MSSVYKVLRGLTLAAVVGAAIVAQAEAATIRISPVSQDATVDDIVTADILVDGLAAGESVGGVSILLSFNEAVLAGFSYLVDPDDKMGVAACGFCDQSFGFDGGTGSPLDLNFLAGILDHDTLKALQGDAFRLATVSFKAIANGLSGLNLSVSPSEGIFLSDATGAELPANAVNGSVCVGGNCTVPEPGLLALLGAGLSGMAVRRRARSRA